MSLAPLTPCRWLPEPKGDELTLRIVSAIRDYHALLGETELAGNRGWLPDLVNDRFGSPRGSPYCANTVGFVLARNGLRVPARDVGACDSWARMGFERATFTHEAKLGAVSLYGTIKKQAPGLPFDAQHVGLVARVDTILGVLDYQANTSAYGYSREGLAVLPKPVSVERLLGYVLPELAD